MNFPSLSVPGIDGGALTDTSLTDSYFSTSFIGVNGFGSPVETKYPLMQVLLVWIYMALNTEVYSGDGDIWSFHLFSLLLSGRWDFRRWWCRWDIGEPSLVGLESGWAFKGGVGECRGWIERDWFHSSVCFVECGMRAFEDRETIEAVECVKKARGRI